MKDVLHALGGEQSVFFAFVTILFIFVCDNDRLVSENDVIFFQKLALQPDLQKADRQARSSRGGAILLYEREFHSVRGAAFFLNLVGNTAVSNGISTRDQGIHI